MKVHRRHASLVTKTTMPTTGNLATIAQPATHRAGGKRPSTIHRLPFHSLARTNWYIARSVIWTTFTRAHHKHVFPVTRTTTLTTGSSAQTARSVTRLVGNKHPLTILKRRSYSPVLMLRPTASSVIQTTSIKAHHKRASPATKTTMPTTDNLAQSA